MDPRRTDPGVSSPGGGHGQDPDVQRLSLETYLDMEFVSNPQISPDGAAIVYTRGWIDKLNDRRRSSLWIMNADGSRNRQLLEGSGARWSPDGNWIAFTARVDDRADFAGVDLPARPDGAKWTGEPKIVERAGYKRDPLATSTPVGRTCSWCRPRVEPLDNSPTATGITMVSRGAPTAPRSTSP